MFSVKLGYTSAEYITNSSGAERCQLMIYTGTQSWNMSQLPILMDRLLQWLSETLDVRENRGWWVFHIKTHKEHLI